MKDGKGAISSGTPLLWPGGPHGDVNEEHVLLRHDKRRMFSLSDIRDIDFKQRTSIYDNVYVVSNQ